MSGDRDQANDCPRCRGVGQAVKRITYRRDGTASTVTYDIKADCAPCKGTGTIVAGASQ